MTGNRQAVCLVALVLAGAMLAAPARASRLLFRSGFEEPVAFTDTSKEHLSGADVGFDWSAIDHRADYGRADALSLGYVQSELVTQNPHTGARCLFVSQEILGGGAQNSLSWGGDDASVTARVYTARWLHFPDLTQALLRNGDSTSITGLSEAVTGCGFNHGCDFMIWLAVTRLSGSLRWELIAADLSAGASYADWVKPPAGWRSTNTSDAVPLGRWFLLELFVERHPVAGIARVWIDGQPVFSLTDLRTLNGTAGGTGQWFAGVYAIDPSGSPRLPVSFWVDDVELWDGLPSEPAPCADKRGRCCESGEVCVSGAFASSTDCGQRCCLGLACAPGPTYEADGGDAGFEPGGGDPGAEDPPMQDGGDASEGGRVAGGCGCGGGAPPAAMLAPLLGTWLARRRPRL